MNVEELESYGTAAGPWQQALSAANAMSINATRIAVGQMHLAALTTRFMNQRLSAYASFDGHVEPLVQRLDKLTEQYADDYAAQVRSVYSSWGDLLREGRPLTEVASPSPDREQPRRHERAGAAKAKAKGRGTNGAKRIEQRRHTSAH
jgi:hypothetical protein